VDRPTRSASSSRRDVWSSGPSGSGYPHRLTPAASKDAAALAGFAGCGDRLGNAALRGALGNCFADGVERRSIADIGRLVLRGPTPEFVGMFEDLLQAAGHSHHLYSLRAVIAWTMTGPYQYRKLRVQ
jgi:hypothetical protein